MPTGVVICMGLPPRYVCMNCSSRGSKHVDASYDEAGLDFLAGDDRGLGEGEVMGTCLWCGREGKITVPWLCLIGDSGRSRDTVWCK